MNISKYNTVIVLISSILTLYVFPIENSSSKNIDSTKTLYFETKQKSYLGKTGKTINLKLISHGVFVMPTSFQNFQNESKKEHGKFALPKYLETKLDL